MFASPTFTGTVAGVTATHVGLGNVTNESKATMFTAPEFTLSGNVGINVTNEGGWPAGMVFKSSGGTIASPTQTGNGYNVLNITARGHIGSGGAGGFTTLGWMEWQSTEAITANNRGSQLGLYANRTGGAASFGLFWNGETFDTTQGSVKATGITTGGSTTAGTLTGAWTLTGSVSGISATMIASLKYAKIEFAVTNAANAGYRLNYPDYSTSNNPIVYAQAGETIAFNLNGISGNHPFLIQVNTAGSWVNYDLGLVHVGLAPTGTVSTGTNAQGKSTGMLYWTLPPDIAPGDYRYICSLHFNMVGTIRVKGADQAITSIRSTATSNVDFGGSWGNVNATYYKWDLPAAGTYLVWGTFRARVWGAAGYVKIRLYNQTAGTVVTDSDNMLLENQQVGQLNVMCTANWRYVATAATTLYLQGISTAGSGAGIQADANGWNECGFIRIT
jgi:plastocyanin